MAFLRRITFVALLSIASAAGSALAQPPGYPNAPPPPHIVPPPPATSANGGAALPPGSLTTQQPTAYPYGGYSPWGYPGYQGAVGGALNGYANVISAAGQAEISNQQARMVQTQADMSRIDYRNAIINQEKYEQALQPTTLELRQKQQWQALQSARNNPSSTEIWNANALNALFTALQGAQRAGLRADPVFIDPDVLHHTNLTTGVTSGAGAGMLKNITKIQWPFALQSPPFKESADKVDALCLKAVEEVKADGRVSAPTFDQLMKTTSALDDTVGSNQELSPADYIQSKGFVDQLLNSIQSLKDPNVAKYLNGAYAAQGPTVADLVDQMTSQGLSFAPATPNDQPQYKVLYQAMLSYDYRLSQLASR
ncbi:MAG TPA: hypothetical protein VMS17_30365 [Gemmataceae bacterium]|nr:hypothetical protein [Gemmataceae bacterium]